jgi:hypothetical protein
MKMTYVSSILAVTLLSLVGCGDSPLPGEPATGFPEEVLSPVAGSNHHSSSEVP